MGKPTEIVLAEGATFACIPGCGFCCTSTPSLDPVEEPRAKAHPVLSRLVIPRADGTLGLNLNPQRTACGALDSERRCSAYADRPRICRTFPFHIHAGERLQVAGNYACPGLDPFETEGLEHEDAQATARDALAAAGAGAGAAALEKARETWREFRRRVQILKEPDPALHRAAFAPLVPRLASPRGAAAMYAVASDQRLTLKDVPHLFDEAETLAAEALPSLERDVFPELAQEMFPDDDSLLPLQVSFRGHARVAHTDHTRHIGLSPGTDAVPRSERAQWWVLCADDEGVTRRRVRLPGAEREESRVAYHDIDPYAVPHEVGAIFAGHLAMLLERDHTLGHAAKLMDLMGYEVTYAASLGRVLADAAAGLLLSACLAAAFEGAPVDARHAREAIRMHDLAFLSQPSVGAVL